MREGVCYSFLESANPKERRKERCRALGWVSGWEKTGQGEGTPLHSPQSPPSSSQQAKAKVKAAERHGREERERRETADTPSSLSAKASQRCCQKGVGQGRAPSGGNRKCCGGNRQGGHGRW